MGEKCWDATHCGKRDSCPAYPNNGRTCYAVTGTLCRGEKQGSYTEKIASCRETCPFYAELMEAEGVTVAKRGA
jgi:methyl-accepting chemotaxis protein